MNTKKLKVINIIKGPQYQVIYEFMQEKEDLKKLLGFYGKVFQYVKYPPQRKRR